MSEIARLAPGRWSVVQRTGEMFADGTPVCEIMDSAGGVVAYCVGYPEARLIVDRVNAARDEADVGAQEGLADG